MQLVLNSLRLQLWSFALILKNKSRNHIKEEQNKSSIHDIVLYIMCALFKLFCVLPYSQTTDGHT